MVLDQNKISRIEHEENPFAMSIGDLMAALLLIFVLLLSSTLLRLQREFENKVNVAERYKNIQIDLYNDLYITFKDSLNSWKANIDSSLTIKFKEPDVLFSRGRSNLKPRFKQILDYFFPKYLEVLTSNKYQENIEEVRIEGHTSSEWYSYVDSLTAYFNNMQLSQDRTRSVLLYCIKSINDPSRVSWVMKKITANGLSSSKLIFSYDLSEDKDASRRVEFRVKTNAEQQIIRIIQLGEQNKNE